MESSQSADTTETSAPLQRRAAWKRSGIISVEERETGIKSTANSLFSAASRWNYHTGDRYEPFKAADEKVPLSVVLVNKKPQHLVFS
jgi:hypothetical protein